MKTNEDAGGSNEEWKVRRALLRPELNAKHKGEIDWNSERGVEYSWVLKRKDNGEDCSPPENQEAVSVLDCKFYANERSPSICIDDDAVSWGYSLNIQVGDYDTTFDNGPIFRLDSWEGPTSWLAENLGYYNGVPATDSEGRKARIRYYTSHSVGSCSAAGYSYQGSKEFYDYGDWTGQVTPPYYDVYALLFVSADWEDYATAITGAVANEVTRGVVYIDTSDTLRIVGTDYPYIITFTGGWDNKAEGLHAYLQPGTGVIFYLNSLSTSRFAAFCSGPQFKQIINFGEDRENIKFVSNGINFPSPYSTLYRGISKLEIESYSSTTSTCKSIAAKYGLVAHSTWYFAALCYKQSSEVICDYISAEAPGNLGLFA